MLKVPQNVDCIVIGGGVSGLAAAATLSKAGKKVLVLEQHTHIGGSCHSWQKDGYFFDTGIFYVPFVSTIITKYLKLLVKYCVIEYNRHQLYIDR